MHFKTKFQEINILPVHIELLILGNVPSAKEQ